MKITATLQAGEPAFPFTEQQLKDFAAYEAVRASNQFNMFSHAREAMAEAGLDDQSYWFTLKNYSALKKTAEAKQ